MTCCPTSGSLTLPLWPPPRRRTLRNLQPYLLQTDTNTLLTHPSIWVRQSFTLQHALFALKHEGIRLGLLVSALRRIPPAELVTWVKATPNSVYGRKLGHLWERLH